MDLNSDKKIFMLGIGGHGMRALALLLKSKNIDIRGADRDYENLRHQTAMQNYELAPEDKADKLLASSDILIYSDAVVPEHPLRQYAERHAIEAMPYQEALGNFASNYMVIAVTGTHGKSSTTALLSHILIEAGLDPNVLIGAPVPAWDNQNTRVGQSDYLVLEADEYREHFLTLKPVHAIITTIDFDHPDYYADLPAVEKAYERFSQKVSREGYIVLAPGLQENHPAIAWPENIILPDTDIHLDDVDLTLPGEHMKNNAALAVTLAVKMGVDKQAAIDSLKSFQGLGRRFEILGEVNNMKIISDYGHHPKEISVTLQAARDKYPDAKIAVAVEVHMPERLSTFFNGYFDALKTCHTVIFPPVFQPKGREKANDHTEELMAKLKDMLENKSVKVVTMGNYDNLQTEFQDLAQNFDIALCFTAGVLDSQLRKITAS